MTSVWGRLAYLVIATALLAGAPQAHAAEQILRFESHVAVAPDGELTVTETLRVNAEGREIRRGIYRDFPLTFRDAGGATRTVPFTLVDVMRDGKPEPFFTQSNSKRIRIYAGDKNTLVSRGEHTYVFRYRTSRQVRWFDGKPELNWNVTGNFWNFPIVSATYRLELPERARPVRWTAFTGNLGERGTNWQGAILNDTLTVTTTRLLAPGEGLTVVAEIPPGIVAPPSSAEEFWYSFHDNRRWIFGGAGLLAVLAFYLFAWSAVGRDPKGGVVIPQFNPPDNVSPALANYITDWGFRDRWRAFTAASLSLAVKGLLRFDRDENDDKSLTLKTTGNKAGVSPQTGALALPSGERAIYNWVKGRGGEAVIDKANGAAVSGIGNTFTKAIESENKNKFFQRNLVYNIGGIVMTVVVIFLLFAFGGLRDEDIGMIAVAGFAGIWICVLLVPLLMSFFRRGSLAGMIRSAIILVILFGFFATFFTVVGSSVPGGITGLGSALVKLGIENPYPILLVGSFAMLNGVFLFLMKAPTALGRPVIEHLAGLKLYLETAESDRMNYQAPEITAERFEALLPYAVALGVEKPWADAFSAVLARAQPDTPQPARVYNPGWGRGWSGTHLATAVAASVAGANAAFASAVPASSSSSGFSSGGGGGGSGGGGGGGGGGGW